MKTEIEKGGRNLELLFAGDSQSHAGPPFALTNSPNPFADTMNKPTNSREVRFVSHPKGIPTAANFTLVESTLPPLQAEQVLVRNLFMSVDPYMRGRLPRPLRWKELREDGGKAGLTQPA